MIIYGGAAILVFLFLIAPLRGRVLRRLARAAPGSIVFTISNRRIFGEALAVAAVGTELGRRATGLTSGPGVSADAFGLTFWDNTPLQYIGSLDWNRIESLEVVDLQTLYRRWSASAILVRVRLGEGTVTVPLLSPNGTRAMAGSRRESTFLLRELETLRTAGVEAQHSPPAP
jgi:hypothetical protein